MGIYGVLFMKIDRYGKAKILTQQEIQLLFTQGFRQDRDRTPSTLSLEIPSRLG